MLPTFPEQTNYDEAARYLVLRAPPLLHWLLASSESRLRFDGWLPTQLTLPGVQERLCDAVARLADLSRGGVPLAALLEIQTRPDATMPGRLLLAGGLLWLLHKPHPLPGDRYELLGLVLNLTGTGDSRLVTTVDEIEWKLIPREVNLATMSADAVLEQIARKEVPPELLAFIPLMQTGDRDATIRRWLEVANQLGDPRRRGDFSLAVVFAKAADCRPAWEKALEGFGMIEADIVTEWKAAAALKARRAEKAEFVVRVLKSRTWTIPDEVASAIKSSTDLAQLDRWVDAALAADSMASFRQQSGL